MYNIIMAEPLLVSTYKEITDTEITKLINCEKIIVSNPSPNKKSSGYHKETGIDLESISEQTKFSMFIREHTLLTEHFSIGLIYWPDSESPIRLVRYNGNHGIHVNKLTGEKLCDTVHIHKLTRKALDAGICGDNHAEATDKYTSLNEALTEFFVDLNITNYLEYFPELQQQELFH
ncbi:MAG: hypothetical protein KC414_14995 [Romboutsia sp.]|nr:hypothetical protein [Romboutsia sp.]